MTPQEYFEQIFELEEKVDFNNKELIQRPKDSKITRILELSQEINELVDKRADLKLKYGWREAYRT